MTWPWGMHLNALYLVVLLFVYLELSRGVLVNRTVDDQFGDSVTGVPPTYEGPSMDGWTQGSTCGTCKAQPDPYLAFQGTWHDSTWGPGDRSENMVNVFFNGSAVYVFIILANNVPNVTSLTSLSFSLDGEVVGTFVHSPTSSETDYEYNVAAYTNENLGNTLHKLTMQTTGDVPILFLFDYLIYS
ncbi:hypothetical protein M0805_008253 [Coniferiporia weirii]|nr:hypothetical protein M0805_008253 [Coniferiporia weirii]